MSSASSGSARTRTEEPPKQRKRKHSPQTPRREPNDQAEEARHEVEGDEDVDGPDHVCDLPREDSAHCAHAGGYG